MPECWLVRKIAKRMGTSVLFDVRNVIEAHWPKEPRPLIVKDMRTKAGWEFIIHLPAGISDDEFLRAEKYFYTACGRRSVQMEVRGATIVLRVLDGTIGDNYPYYWQPAPYQDMALPVPVGYSVRGFEVVDQVRAPHCMVWGSAGGGKTNLLRTIVVSLRLGRPDTIILIVDLKETDFVFAENHAVLLTDTGQAEEALYLLNRELDRRKKVLRGARVENIQEYARAGRQPLPYVVLIVDELAEIADEREIMRLLDRLTRLGRYVGIQIILASQRMDSRLNDTIARLKVNCPARISFYMPDAINSRMILDNDRATMIPKKPGRAVMKWSDEVIEFQAMNLPVREAERILAPIPPREGGGFIEPTPTLLPAGPSCH